MMGNCSELYVRVTIPLHAVRAHFECRGVLPVEMPGLCLLLFLPGGTTG
eukprot:COSAG05_NODE_1010_length_6207_cov_3.771447_9_plen_49_part_00